MKKKHHSSFTFIGKVTLYICIKIYNTGYKETPGYPLVLQITWPQIQTFRETLLRIFTKASELVKLISSIFDSPHMTLSVNPQRSPCFPCPFRISQNERKGWCIGRRKPPRAGLQTISWQAGTGSRGDRGLLPPVVHHYQSCVYGGEKKEITAH